MRETGRIKSYPKDGLYPVAEDNMILDYGEHHLRKSSSLYTGSLKCHHRPCLKKANFHSVLSG